LLPYSLLPSFPTCAIYKPSTIRIGEKSPTAGCWRISARGWRLVAEEEDRWMESNRKSIIIVEDEPDTAEMFAEMVRLSGYDVRRAAGSSAAIFMISQEQPSVVLLDWMLPDVSGIEVLRYLRREPETAQIPVIVVSAKSLPSDIKSGLEAGASLYLTKPVAFSDLIQAIEKVTQAGR
jgi:CheY-like chemotaxis protein